MRRTITRGRTVSTAVALIWLACGVATAAELTVERAVVAEAVEEREPVGVATAFSADVGRVYFHTTFRGDVAETTVEHVWSLAGEEKARVALDVRGSTYRTWSSKSIPPEWAGAWTVAVVDDGGRELASVGFTVGGAE